MSSESEENNIGHSGSLEALKSLDDLAIKYKEKSQSLLIWIFVVFFTSVILFLYSDSISSLGNNLYAVSNEEKLNNYIRELREDVFKAQSIHERIFKDSEEYLKEQREKIDPKLGGQSLQEALASINLDRELDNALSIATDNLTEARKRLVSALDSRHIAITGDYASTKSNGVANIISVSVTRIGAVMLSVFMIQILLGSYRYNELLSNYYNGRAIAARSIYNDTPDKLPDFLTKLTPEIIAFGKVPQLPIEKLIEMIKAAK